MTEVRIEGYDELKRKLGRDWEPTIRALTLAIGEALRNVIAVYPPKNPGPVKWASLRQKIWYFAARREAGLPAEYTRNSDPWSQRLGPGRQTMQKSGDFGSWAVENTGKLDAVLESHASYAAYVQKAGMQQPMHQATGWITDEQAIANLKKSGDMEEIGAQILEKALGA